MIRRVTPRGLALRASGDRWLFGYADMVTLLFACFASLYATRVAPAATAQIVTSPEKATAARAPAAVPMVPAAAAGDKIQPAASIELHDRLAAIVGGADRVIPGVELTGSNRGVVISLPEAGSFPPGRAELSLAGRRVMLELAATLRDLSNLIRVEGHTDNLPIHTSLFSSNWDLSTARATRVVQFLIDDCGLDPARLAAAGYAEHRPRLPNDSPEARARNRRVDIVVLDPATAILEEPRRPGQ